jgi:hypothetical protein
VAFKDLKRVVQFHFHIALNVKSEAKSPKVKTLSEEEPSFTTVSKEELSERSAEAQQNRAYTYFYRLFGLI